MRRIVQLAAVCAWVVSCSTGCRHETVGELPMLETTITFADKFFDVAAIDNERAVIVGYAGKILYTEDGGTTWEIRDAGTDLALYSVDFVDPEHGWIVGQNGLILRTTDGGRTWERQRPGIRLYLFAVDFLDRREGWVVGDRATYLYTTDGGETWLVRKFGASATLTMEEALMAQDPILYDVEFVDRRTGWVVGEFGKIYHTWDGGQTWTEQQESLLGTAGIFDPLDIPTFFGVDFIDPMNGIVAGLQGRIARTRDGGQTWRFEPFDVEIPIIDPLFEVFQFPDTTGWGVGAAGEVVRQLSPGQPWRRADLGMEVLTWIRSVDFSDRQHGWLVGGRGHVLRTTDGGKTWIPMV